jgi:hypothetical protein
MQSVNFDRLFNRHRVTLAEERVIANMVRNFKNSRNDAERRQRNETMKRYYNELDKKHSWMTTFIDTYNSLPTKSNIKWTQLKRKVATTFSWTAKGWTEALSPLRGDFFSASDGFYDPVLMGSVKVVLTIRGESSGVVKVTTNFENLLETVDKLHENIRALHNQDSIISGYIHPDENEYYTVIVKFVVDRFSFEHFLQKLNEFGINN